MNWLWFVVIACITMLGAAGMILYGVMQPPRQVWVLHNSLSGVTLFADAGDCWSAFQSMASRYGDCDQTLLAEKGYEFSMNGSVTLVVHGGTIAIYSAAVQQ